MADFTPGPWDLDEGDLSIYALDECGGTVWLFQVHEDCDAGVMEFAEATANARLGAAAPDLLEALKWFIDDIDGTHTEMVEFDANVERARAAISKATGEQP